MNESKLYSLLYVEGEAFIASPLCYSHDTRKLMAVCPQKVWYSRNELHDRSLRHATKDGEYPKYLIREVPLVV